MDETDDLCRVNDDSEDAILHVLKNRYEEDRIYTNVGEILLAVNPCKELAIYGKEDHDKYHWKHFDNQLPPHIFNMANRAYRRMCQTGENQIVLVCGESGAGKTENAKYMLKHLMHTCICEQGIEDLKSKILKLDIILESFGNARTKINTNASRFAKLLQLSFRGGKFIEANVRDYMLDKTRVVAGKENCKEGNFHIFHALCAGLSAEEKQILHLQREGFYTILLGSNENLQEKEKYIKRYRDVEHALRSFAVTSDEFTVLKKILAAILLLSEIKFVKPVSRSVEIEIKNEEQLKQVAELMSVKSDDLKKGLLMKTLSAGDEFQHNSIAEAELRRDALAKRTYERLFGWVVSKINKNLQRYQTGTHEDTNLGILDIPGFGNLEDNRFEQMCINLVNEKLQIFVNDRIIKSEMEIYQEEDTNPEFWDITKGNESVVEIFENKMIGIWTILGDESSLSYGRDLHFVERLQWNFRDQTPQLIEFRQGCRAEFCIKHLVGEVWYNCEDILEKNRDTLTIDLEDVMKKSNDQQIRMLFSTEKSLTGTFSSSRKNNGQSSKSKTKRKRTVLDFYRESVNELMRELKRSSPHFVRCIKPEDKINSSSFDEEVVRKQLKYNGIFQIAKIRKLEFSVQITIKDFIRRYNYLIPEMHAEPTKEYVEAVLGSALPSEMKDCFKVGEDKVFMEEKVDIHMKMLVERERQLIEKRTGQEKTERQIKTRGRQSEIKRVQEEEITVMENDLEEYTENEDSDQTNVKIYKENESAESSAQNDNDTSSSSKAKSWDRFKVLDREKKQNDVHSHTSFRIIKILVYLCLFIILLSSMVIQKISLVIATSKLGNNTELEQQNSTTNQTVSEVISDSGVHSFLLLFAICIPYILNFLASCWKIFFGNMKRPRFTSILMCVTIEAFHSIGLCILVFQIMPDLGAVQRICVLSATSIIPSLLKPFSVKERKKITKCRKVTIILVDVLALIVQISVIPVLLLPSTEFLSAENGSETARNSGGVPGIFKEMSYDSFMYTKVIAAFLLTSLSWWENFAADNGCFSKTFQRGIDKVKYELQESRPYFCVVVSITKIAMTVLSARLLVGERMGLLNPAFWSAVANYNNIRLFSDIIALVISGFVGYYVAYTACKLQMQRFSFSIPCLISTPIFITVMTFYCDDSDDYLSMISSNNLDITCDYDHGIENNWFHITVIVAWLISLYWVGQHIWFPSQERLAKMKRLFVNPLYCGIMMEQHLVMNRRRHLKEIPNTENTKTKEEKDSVNTEQDENQSKGRSGGEEKIHPRVFACATLWHETLNEMKQLLKSLYRIDKDQSERNEKNQDYYEFEAHILFDDAFQKNNLNDFVKHFASVMDETASAVHAKATELEKPLIICTVYGAQIVYKMPGGNLMFIHLKDKAKIRKKKRWSQVMYMYYLLGYRLTCEVQDQKGREETFDEILKPRANNTFLLALDGDVDFSPGSLRILVDRMRKDERVGATCGRIHPIGSGPIVWYQKFEYAVAHWLQKATEHVLGCVLCSPGCFSLFRGSALMDDNVMNKYTQTPTEASHHLMYDQGEDRWLCTLLLQQGYRVDYAAGADAFTYAPEGFNEYFKQRKRWGPSTLANIMSLLQDCKNTVQANANISWLYILYQGSLLVATIIGPATIVMMIAGAFVAVFGVDLLTSYIASLAPVILYFIICVTCNSNIQLLVAQILSGIYVIIMIVVFVGVIITAVTESPFHPSVIFFCGIIAIFVIAALFHPREWDNLLFGLLYFVLVPCGFLVLIIYSLCNLNDVSWGTRESGKAKAKVKEKKTIFSKIISPFRKSEDTVSKPYMSEDDVKLLVAKILEHNLTKDKTPDDDLKEVVVCTEGKKNATVTSRSKSIESIGIADRDIESEPEWISKHPRTFKGNRIEMTPKENEFWKKIIDTYLKPPESDEAKEDEDKEKLKELRNNVCAGMAILNLIWISINFMFQLRRPTVVTLAKLENGDKIETDVLGLLFIIFFTLILVLQFCGMVMHRWGTFLHLVAITEIPNPFLKPEEDPTPQYQSSPKEEHEVDFKKQIENLSLRGRRYKRQVEFMGRMKKRIDEQVRKRKQSNAPDNL